MYGSFYSVPSRPVRGLDWLGPEKGQLTLTLGLTLPPPMPALSLVDTETGTFHVHTGGEATRSDVDRSCQAAPLNGN